MGKAKKNRAGKYEEKLAINGSFEEVLNLSAQPLDSKKPSTMIAWNTQKDPPETGTYLASIIIQGPHGRHAFYDALYYEKDSKEWYKYDPFDLSYKPKERVNGRVTGWSNDIGVHLV